MRAQVINPATGEVREAEVFVAALGASNYTYAEVRNPADREHSFWLNVNTDSGSS